MRRTVGMAALELQQPPDHAVHLNRPEPESAVRIGGEAARRFGELVTGSSGTAHACASDTGCSAPSSGT